VRVTNGCRLLYRLPDSILPVTVTDITHSMCRVTLKKLKTYSAARDTPYLYGTRMPNAVATKGFCSKTADIMSWTHAISSHIVCRIHFNIIILSRTVAFRRNKQKFTHRCIVPSSFRYWQQWAVLQYCSCDTANNTRIFVTDILHFVINHTEVAHSVRWPHYGLNTQGTIVRFPPSKGCFSSPKGPYEHCGSPCPLFSDY